MPGICLCVFVFLPLTSLPANWERQASAQGRQCVGETSKRHMFLGVTSSVPSIDRDTHMLKLWDAHTHFRCRFARCGEPAGTVCLTALTGNNRTIFEAERSADAVVWPPGRRVQGHVAASPTSILHSSNFLCISCLQDQGQF